MAYTYQTQWDSPNYTPALETKSSWGVERDIQHIDIHWWDSPDRNPSYEGVITRLCNPDSGVSAHYVATGTGRRVACLVSPEDNSWATVQDNPYSISIECDPRCRDEDYDVVAELIADIRSAYGDHLTLHPHREFLNTTCPGNWDLERLDALSRKKVSHDDWGAVTTIVDTPPVVIPPVTPPVVIPPVVTPPVTPPVVDPPVVIPPVIPTSPAKESPAKIAVNVLVTFIQAALAVWATSNFAMDKVVIAGAIGAGLSVVWNTILKPLLIKLGWLK